MFERYTEKARRVIFFARYEASQCGSPQIEPHHLLLAILQEQPEVLPDNLRGAHARGEIRARFERDFPKQPKLSTSVDIPLSNPSKRVLAYAAEESERLLHRHIGCEHLYLGLMREEGSAAADVLRDSGVPVADARVQVAKSLNQRLLPLQALAGRLPDDRLPAAELLLEALASQRVSITVVTPEKQFTVTFGQPPDKPADV